MADTDVVEFMNRFGAFITDSPTSYHTVENVAEILDKAGFVKQDEADSFDTAAGGHYFIRDGAIMAWFLPKGADTSTGFRVVGSHTDSPSFKLKPNPKHDSAGWQQCGMEIYGGPLFSSWLNRDLGLAGRIATKDGQVKLVQTGAVAVIPQLAPHLDREQNNDLELSKQKHLMPLYAAGEPDFDILDYLCEQAGVARENVGFYDVHATAVEPPALIGTHNQFFAAWRMDNLSSVFASVEAMVNTEFGDDIAVLAAFDHEEVGSCTRTGACGPILEDTLRRITASLDGDDQDFRRMIGKSSCISADAGHAVNPNYPEKHDPDNRPQFNQGAVLKINGNQRYATDALSGALWERVCDAADVPSQAFVGNNDVPCGTTIGPLTAARLGILTVDVGIPLLSMHSSRELCGSEDIGYLTEVLKAYWAGA